MTALRLDGPLVVASGCAGTGRELLPYTSLDGTTVVTRTVTLDPHHLTARRLVGTTHGFLHDGGVDSAGLEPFLATELPGLVRAGARVHVSVSGPTSADVAALAARLGTAPGVAGVELNLSAQAPGLVRAASTAQVAGLVDAVRDALTFQLPLLVKLGHRHGLEHARAAQSAGADGLVVSGAVPALLPDSTPGVLVGPSVLPVALRRLAEIAEAVTEIPVLGNGGVTCAADVRRYLALGAVAVQVGSALLHDPTTLTRIGAELAGSYPSRRPEHRTHQEDP